MLRDLNLKTGEAVLPGIYIAVLLLPGENHLSYFRLNPCYLRLIHYQHVRL